MRKTGLEIEQDIYLLLKDKEIVSGGVFISRTRPFDTISEDIVVKHLSGVDGWGGFDQTGIVIVNYCCPLNFRSRETRSFNPSFPTSKV